MNVLYKLGLLFASGSQTTFFVLAFTIMDTDGSTWILYSTEYWTWSMFLALLGFTFMVVAIIRELIKLFVRKPSKPEPVKEIPRIN